MWRAFTRPGCRIDAIKVDSHHPGITFDEIRFRSGQIEIVGKLQPVPKWAR
jgi:hypothetical protein